MWTLCLDCFIDTWVTSDKHTKLADPCIMIIHSVVSDTLALQQ